MLIHVADLVAQHGLSGVSGVLHLGAHFGEEADAYDQHMPWTHGPRVVWVEGNPDLVPILARHVEHRPGHEIVTALVDDEARDVRFHIASNEGASSSVLEFGTHADVHPNITYTGDRDARTTTVDDLDTGWDDLNFVCLDLQGLELRALQGAADLMSHVDYVFTEVNREPLYVGCPLIGDLDEHLADFRRVAVTWTEFGWGDAFYARNC